MVLYYKPPQKTEAITVPAASDLIFPSDHIGILCEDFWNAFFCIPPFFFCFFPELTLLGL